MGRTCAILPGGPESKAPSNVPIHVYRPAMMGRVLEKQRHAPTPTAFRMNARNLAKGVGCGSVPVSERHTIEQKEKLGGLQVTPGAWGHWSCSPQGPSAEQVVHQVVQICENVQERLKLGGQINATSEVQAKQLLDLAVMLSPQYKRDIVLTIGPDCGKALRHMTIDPTSESKMTYDGHLADFAFKVQDIPFSGIVLARPGEYYDQRMSEAAQRIATHMRSSLQTKRKRARTAGNSTQDITEPCFTIIDERIFVYFAHIDLVSDDDTVRLIGPFEDPRALDGCELETLEGSFQTLQLFVNALKCATEDGQSGGSLR